MIKIGLIVIFVALIIFLVALLLVAIELFTQDTYDESSEYKYYIKSIKG